MGGKSEHSYPLPSFEGLYGGLFILRHGLIRLERVDQFHSVALTDSPPRSMA